ncbi:MAG: polymerase, partial [Paenibacillus sp.]|nr:polymerase [Paenibacillus sp.]
MNKLIIIDGNSVAYRAFFALPLLSNSSGLHTNAVFGFTTMLLKLMEEEKPTHFLVAFDAGKITFRHKGYEQYKGGRAKTPPELSEQFPVVKDLLRSFGISQFEIEGYEADDIIGTMTRLADENQFPVVIVSGDKDMLQLSSEYVTVAITRKGVSEVERFTPEHIQETYGLKPHQIIDLKGLMGDASDNIPGIPGVGEKTALKLLHQYGSVEGVLAAVGEIPGKMQEKIREHADSATMSKDLATIYREVPLDLPWEGLKYEGYDPQLLGDMFRKLEFKSLLDKLELPASQQSSEPKEQLVTSILDAAGLPAFVEKLSKNEVETLHVEVIGENPHIASVIGLSFYSEESCYYISLELLKTEAAEPVRAWLADGNEPKSVYDMHRAEIALSRHNIDLQGVSFDILIAAYLLDPTESNHTLNALARRYGLPGIAADEDVFGKGAKFKLPEVAELSEQLCRKTTVIHRLVPLLRHDLENNEMNQLYYELEKPLACVLASMEKLGISVDSEGLRKLGGELAKSIEKLVTTIYDLAGIEFNINSPKQLGDILFDKLQLPVIKKTKTGYSTDAEVLEKLAPYHEIVTSLLHYRQLAKLQSTYVEGLLKEIRPESGKVHTYYQQTIAATGRLSSQFPN